MSTPPCQNTEDDDRAKPSTQMECDAKGMCLAKEGQFLMDGFRLHMPGSWLFSVKVTMDKKTLSGEARYEF